MNARSLAALACALFMPLVLLGQESSALDYLKSAYPYRSAMERDAPIELPVVRVFGTQARFASEDVVRQLEKMFSPRKEISIVIVGDSLEKEATSHRLKDSALAEFAVSGARDIKRFKDGVGVAWLGGLTVYSGNSGVSWKPRPYLTYTVGKKNAWRYSFRNGHDLYAEFIRKPIESFNRALERPILKLVDRLSD